MTKRYCSKCEYLEWVPWRNKMNSHGWVCTSPVPIVNNPDWFSDGKTVGTSGDDPEQKNKNNDCKDYKRKREDGERWC